MLNIFKGATLYDRFKRIYFEAPNDMNVNIFQRHEGHVRFINNEESLALTYKGNKGKYRFTSENQEESEPNI